MIAVVLIAGLLTAGGTLIEEQQRAVATDQLTVAGQQLAAGFEDADRLAATTDNGTIRVNVWLPDSVAGGQYRIRIVNHPQPPDQPALATVVATAESADARRNVSFRTDHAVPNRTLSGGPILLVYSVDGTEEEGDWRITANPDGADGVDPEQAAIAPPGAFDPGAVDAVERGAGTRPVENPTAGEWLYPAGGVSYP